MAPDLSEFEALMPRRGPCCSVAKVLVELDDEAAEKLRAAIAAPHIPDSAVRLWLEGHGHRVGVSAVGNHRRGQCACE